MKNYFGAGLNAVGIWIWVMNFYSYENDFMKLLCFLSTGICVAGFLYFLIKACKGETL